MLAENLQKFWYYHWIILINMNNNHILTKVELQSKISVFIILQEKLLKNKIKTIDDQSGKQIKALQEHGKQLAESNEFIKNTYHLITKKKYSKNLLKKELIKLKNYTIILILKI